MHKYFSPFVVVMLLLPLAFCWGQQPDNLFTTPFVEPLASDSVSVGQAKARMQELKDKIAYYFPEDYSFHVVSYENERIIDRLKFYKTICRGAKRGAIVGGCLSVLLATQNWDLEYVGGLGIWAPITAMAIVTGALTGSAASALFYTGYVSEKERVNINDTIRRYNAITEQKVGKP